MLRNRVVADNHPNFGDPTAIGSEVPPLANAWEQPGATSVPPLLPSRRWPTFAARGWSRIVSAFARLGG